MQKNKENILISYLKSNPVTSKVRRWILLANDFEDRWVGLVLRYKITGFFIISKVMSKKHPWTNKRDING